MSLQGLSELIRAIHCLPLAATLVLALSSPAIEVKKGGGACIHRLQVQQLKFDTNDTSELENSKNTINNPVPQNEQIRIPPRR